VVLIFILIITALSYFLISKKEVSMTYAKVIVTFLLIILFAGCSTPPQKNKIEGVWQIMSEKVDGKEILISGKDWKYITAKHWIWIYQDKGKCLSLLEKKTQRDSISAYYDEFGAGAGTYKLIGNTYTETIEYFVDPNYVGLSIDFTVKVEGDSLHQSGKFPMLEGSKKVREVMLDEVYKRIE
jgi:hypothetical protein